MSAQSNIAMRAEVLIEALPFIQQFRGARIVVKYGGAAMVDEDLKRSVCQDVALLHYVGMRPVVVHGGGKKISEVMNKLGLEPQFIEGLRVTDDATMEVAEMVLVGTIGQDLAKKIARDGEGSSKFVTVDVTGAATYEQAHAVARAVTKYNLVKTCIWGEDFNWGRVAAAIGASGADVDPATVQIAIGGLTAFAAGEPVEYDLYQAGTIMKSDEIEITIDLGAGQQSAIHWSCDLTPTFVELNAH